jgi:hypothetical protein
MILWHHRSGWWMIEFDAGFEWFVDVAQHWQEAHLICFPMRPGEIPEQKLSVRPGPILEMPEFNIQISR